MRKILLTLIVFSTSLVTWADTWHHNIVPKDIWYTNNVLEIADANSNKVFVFDASNDQKTGAIYFSMAILAKENNAVFTLTILEDDNSYTSAWFGTSVTCYIVKSFMLRD